VDLIDVLSFAGLFGISAAKSGQFRRLGVSNSRRARPAGINSG
jgi:hypothetical protein